MEEPSGWAHFVCGAVPGVPAAAADRGAGGGTAGTAAGRSRECTEHTATEGVQ